MFSERIEPEEKSDGFRKGSTHPYALRLPAEISYSITSSA